MQVSNQIQTPTVNEDAWDAFRAVQSHRKTGALAAVFGLNEADRDAPVIELVGRVDVGDAHPWAKMTALLDAQELRWIALTLPYTTESGGQREKFCFVRWCSDNLTRDSFKESVRLKSGAVMFAAELAAAAHTAGATKIQANDYDDITIDAVLEKASKHERDAVDKSSIDKLR